jgi:hypothetical protein
LSPISDRLGRRADEDQSGLGDGLGEVGVLGQEAVAGVDGVDAGLRRHLEDLVDVEVALGGGGRAEQVGLVGEADVRRVAVDLAVDRDAGRRARGRHG